MAKKRINSKAKGNRPERDVAQILSDYFNDKFSRVGVSSGARTKNSDLPEDSVQFYAGDIICPSGWKYSIECKSGYDNASLTTINATIDSFIEQAENDAVIAGKQPLILFKQSREPWVCMIKEEYKKCTTYVKYRDYFIYDFKEILEKKEDWYDKKNLGNIEKPVVTDDNCTDC